MFNKSCRGDVILDVILFTGIILFIILPVFSFTFEKYIYQNSIQLIKDTLDMTAIASYDTLNQNSSAKNDIDFDTAEFINTYKKYLAKNMKLNEDLSSEQDSIANGVVRVEQLELYTSDFPVNCASGFEIDKISVHALVVIPLKPNLYRKIILEALGKDFIELKVHHDTELPVNN